MACRISQAMRGGMVRRSKRGREEKEKRLKDQESTQEPGEYVAKFLRYMLRGEKQGPAPGLTRFREGGRGRGAGGASGTEGDLSGVSLGLDTLPVKDLVPQGN